MRDNDILVRHIKPAALSPVRQLAPACVPSYARWLKLRGADVKDAQRFIRIFGARVAHAGPLPGSTLVARYLAVCSMGRAIRQSRIGEMRSEVPSKSIHPPQAFRFDDFPVLLDIRNNPAGHLRLIIPTSKHYGFAVAG